MKHLLCILLLVSLLGCGLTAPNKTEKLAEEASAVGQSEVEKPVGVNAHAAAGGTVEVNLGNEAVAQKSKSSKHFRGNSDYSASAAIKNPFTLILLAIGMVSVWLAASYVVKRATGRQLSSITQAMADKVASGLSKVDETIESALTDAETDKEKELLRRVQSSVNKVG